MSRPVMFAIGALATVIVVAGVGGVMLLRSNAGGEESASPPELPLVMDTFMTETDWGSIFAAYEAVKDQLSPDERTAFESSYRYAYQDWAAAVARRDNPPEVLDSEPLPPGWNDDFGDLPPLPETDEAIAATSLSDWNQIAFEWVEEFALLYADTPEGEEWTQAFGIARARWDEIQETGSGESIVDELAASQDDTTGGDACELDKSDGSRPSIGRTGNAAVAVYPDVELPDDVSSRDLGFAILGLVDIGELCLEHVVEMYENGVMSPEMEAGIEQAAQDLSGG